jgi:phosphoribosylformylglycinamidine cyclo-ligase
MKQQSFTYRDAGVNIDAGAALVERIKPLAAMTRRPEVVTDLGGFSGLFALPLQQYRQPLLVSGTDGVGTKLKLALDFEKHDTIGIDLVAMCVNDVLVTGAEPLFFLDYYATGQLVIEQASAIIAGIAEGCHQAGCALLGGETAEMPGLYNQSDYDLAGFCVGIVEQDALLGAHNVQIGDALVAIASSGPHANGYSLIRKILATCEAPPQCIQIDSQNLEALLLEPTRIYVRSLRPQLQRCAVHALAHITGGGLVDNLPRVLPQGTKAVIDTRHWVWPPIFKWLQQQGHISDFEMLRTFNCGIGMMACLPASSVDLFCTQLQQAGETAWYVGTVEAHDAPHPLVELR